MSIEEYFGDWSGIVNLKEADSIMKRLASSKVKVCPDLNNVFRAFLKCPYHKLTTVILGQDPYPTLLKGKPVATGIAFANSKDTLENQLSPSLKVLTESVIDYSFPHGIVNFDHSFEKWEEQGVLLINTSLSCEVGKSGSHSLLWRPFIKDFLSKLSSCTSGIIYILLGEAACSFKQYIHPATSNILCEKHPSWYYRNKQRMPSDIWRSAEKLFKYINGYDLKLYDELSI